MFLRLHRGICKLLQPVQKAADLQYGIPMSLRPSDHPTLGWLSHADVHWLQPILLRESIVLLIPNSLLLYTPCLLCAPMLVRSSVSSIAFASQYLCWL
jgi:hypothetical protein